MTENLPALINNLYQQYPKEIRSEWLVEVMRIWGRQYPGLVNEAERRSQISVLLNELANVFNAHIGETIPQITTNSQLGKIARELSSQNAKT